MLYISSQQVSFVVATFAAMQVVAIGRQVLPSGILHGSCTPFPPESRRLLKNARIIYQDKQIIEVLKAMALYEKLDMQDANTYLEEYLPKREILEGKKGIRIYIRHFVPWTFTANNTSGYHYAQL